uniref:UDP-N-acetyl-D-mannosamine dehydrogenase n=1 Tax=Candidatus Aschnera chinzeii TaxID=1485666 RepID=A0AAT9G4P8_9ENTR|nr:MAG: UDP-N-acetyl-D-mannosamine dehydrogenase [Candidatus Aschnera chinzeii]
MVFKNISVIGLGYVGLSIAASFANKKQTVLGIDNNQNIINMLNQGKIHIHEPQLKNKVQKAIKNGYLQLFRKPQLSDVYLIAVPTPFKNKYIPNIDYIINVINTIAPLLKKGNLIIVESTIPVGTTDKIAQLLAKIRTDLTFPQHSKHSDINIAYCPERVLPGDIMNEIIKNDRIIGGMTTQCSKHASKLYKIILEGHYIYTNHKTAEICKLVENSYRDVNIAFANELAYICEKENINVWEVINLANRHPRVNILQPGPGVGGHCIAVDPWFIITKYQKIAKLIHTARNINNQKPLYVAKHIKMVFKNYKIKTNKAANKIIIACFGITYKADIDDIRESPSIKIIEKLTIWHKGPIYIIEPNIHNMPKSLNKNCQLVSIDTAIKYADIIVFLVDHKEFKCINKDNISQQCIIDVKGIWN